MARRKKRGVTLAEIRRWPAAVDVTQAAEAYDISRASAYQAIAEGCFPAQVIRVNRRMRVLTASIIASLEGGGDRAGVA
jgi:hypothetical protein